MYRKDSIINRKQWHILGFTQKTKQNKTKQKQKTNKTEQNKEKRLLLNIAEKWSWRWNKLIKGKYVS